MKLWQGNCYFYKIVFCIDIFMISFRMKFDKRFKTSAEFLFLWKLQRKEERAECKNSSTLIFLRRKRGKQNGKSDIKRV